MTNILTRRFSAAITVRTTEPGLVSRDSVSALPRIFVAIATNISPAVLGRPRRSELEKGIQHAERKRIYETLHPEAKNGAKGGWHNNKTENLETDNLSVSSYAADAATATGVTRQAIAVWEDDFSKKLTDDNLEKWQEIAEAVDVPQNTISGWEKEFLEKCDDNNSRNFSDFGEKLGRWTTCPSAKATPPMPHYRTRPYRRRPRNFSYRIIRQNFG